MSDELAKRIIILETQMEERWKAHDKQSLERHELIKSELEDIKNILKGVKCETHTERFKGVQTQINWIWAICVCVVSAVIGQWVKK